MAYARFRGQALPTIHHWARAAFAPHEAWFNTAPADCACEPLFRGRRPCPRSSAIGLGPWGTFHMAGNVREWVWNFAGTSGLAMGGAWSDYATLYQTAYTTSPMQRLPENGMRLMHPLASADVSGELLKPITLALDNPSVDRKPVSDEAFQAMRFQFTSARTKPKETLVQQVQETPLWIAEEVILKFANQETTTLYIVRPKSRRNPMQPVIYGPPADCCFLGKRPNRNALGQMRPPADTIVNSGRALVIPIWDTSYERALPPQGNPEEMADRMRRAALAFYQDVSATLDYLETRPDIDMQRTGYMGFSYGAGLIGPIVLATEGRLKTAILISGGLQPQASPHGRRDQLRAAHQDSGADGQWALRPHLSLTNSRRSACSTFWERRRARKSTSSTMSGTSHFRRTRSPWTSAIGSTNTWAPCVSTARLR